MQRALAVVAVVVAGLLGLPAAGTLLAGTRATPLAGNWSGAHALRITGSLEGGFAVVAGIVAIT